MERIILMAGINIKYPLATAIRENRYIGQLLPLLPPSHIVIPNSSGQKKTPLCGGVHLVPQLAGWASGRPIAK
jgi:hypothetical protein